MQRLQRFALLIVPIGLGCGVLRPRATAVEGLPAGIEAQFSAPTEVRQGDSLMMTLTVSNVSSKPVTLDLYARGDWSFDPIVRGKDGTILWERGVGSGSFMSSGLAIGLPSRGQHQFAAVWQRVAVPGTGSRTVHVTPRLLGPQGTAIWTGAVVHITVRE